MFLYVMQLLSLQLVKAFIVFRLFWHYTRFQFFISIETGLSPALLHANCHICYTHTQLETELQD